MRISKKNCNTGLHMAITKRSFLKSSAILAGAGILSSPSIPVWAQDAYAEMKPRWLSAGFDWRQQEGATITLAALEHPWMAAIEPLIPHFTRLTGVEVKVQKQSETEYIAEMPVKLGAGSTTPDVFMVWSLGQAISAGWLQPLDDLAADNSVSDSAWYDSDDVFGSARSFEKWADGNTYARSITAEAQTMFYNQSMLDAAGRSVPTTMEELYATAVAMKTDDVAGIAMRAKATGDAASWTGAGWVFSYGGGLIDPASGEVIMDSPEAIAGVESYAALLRDAGPLGISSYHWAESLNDFTAGASAIFCDSSAFIGSVEDASTSTISGNVAYGAVPAAGSLSAKPNMWHWTAGMNSKSENKVAAWLFLTWATSKPTCALAAAAGLSTARSSAWETSAFADSLGQGAAQAALANLQSADGDLFKAAWFHKKSPQILDPFAIGINETVTGAKSAADAMADAAKKVRAAI